MRVLRAVTGLSGVLLTLAVAAGPALAAGFPLLHPPACGAADAVATAAFTNGGAVSVTAAIWGGTVTAQQERQSTGGGSNVWLCTGKPSPAGVAARDDLPAMGAVAFFSVDADDPVGGGYGAGYVDYTVRSPLITPDSHLYALDLHGGYVFDGPLVRADTWVGVGWTANAGVATFTENEPLHLMIVDPHVAYGAAAGPAPVATALPTPRQAFSDPVAIAVTAAVTVGLLVFITFPANLFNETFEEHYADLTGLVQRPLQRLRRTRTPRQPRPPSTARQRLAFAAVVVAGALLGGLLNPGFGPNLQTLAAVLAAGGVTLCSAGVALGVSHLYRHGRKRDRETHLKALPLGLAIGAGCVLVSRLTDFQPGYLYGIVAGVVFASQLPDNERAHVIAFEHLAILATGVAAWFAWLPVNHWALDHPSWFALAFLDDFLASMFAGALVGNVVNLMPVRFLPGHALARWHRGAWAATFGIAVFALLAVLVRPTGNNHPGAVPWVTGALLFLGFGGGSVGLKWLLDRRFPASDPDPDPVDVDPPVPVPVPAPDDAPVPPGHPVA